jgi:hypothetical protein
MKTLFTIGVALLIFTSSAFAEGNFKGRPIVNNIDMPTGNTLNQGEFTVGLESIGFGVTNNLQVGTNILPYLVQYHNVNVKVNLVESPNMALATGVDFGRFDLDIVGVGTDFNSLSPFVALSTRVSPATTLHFAGRYSHFSDDIDGAEPEEISTGTSASVGVDYSLSNRTKFLAEAGYDATFDGPRLGGAVLFGWRRFRLKLGVNYYNPEDANASFTLPIISLWWRFNG